MSALPYARQSPTTFVVGRVFLRRCGRSSHWFVPLKSYNDVLRQMEGILSILSKALFDLTTNCRRARTSITSRDDSALCTLRGHESQVDVKCWGQFLRI
jgi:hypothetical protein